MEETKFESLPPFHSCEGATLDKPRRRAAPRGRATSNLVLSSYVGENSDLFARILDLHVPRGSTIADVTYGQGTFWRKVAHENYVLYPTDLNTGIDCRNLPYRDGEIDCVVLDPPYMEGFYRHDTSFAGQGTHTAFKSYYSNGERPLGLGAKWHDAVLEMYIQAAIEAERVLKHNGVLIVKCQDEVSGGIQRLTHVEIIINYAALGFYAKDLFILTRRNRPCVSRALKQLHARKNHSYFIVFLKNSAKAKRSAAAFVPYITPKQESGT